MSEKRNRDAEHYFATLPKSQPKLHLIHTNLRGNHLEFLTASSVFSKKRVDPGTRLLIEVMFLPEKGTVLDLGCGYGAVGIAAAASNPRLHVIMTDVNMRAVRLAKRNAKKNNVHNAEARYGYLYEPVEDLMFNCVLSNPPISAGMETVKAIITRAPKFMMDKAVFQIVIRSKIGAKTLPTFLKETFGNCHIRSRKSGYRVLIAERQ